MNTTLVRKLMFYAEAIQREDQNVADTVLQEIQNLSATETDTVTSKVVNCFVEALNLQNRGVRPTNYVHFSNLGEFQRYRQSPFYLFAVDTTNDAILNAISSQKRVHVIDFSAMLDSQWYHLMLYLASRGDGPPSLRITSIIPKLADNFEYYLQAARRSLDQLAQMLGIDLEWKQLVFNGVTDLLGHVLQLERDTNKEETTVIVKWVFELHKLLALNGAIGQVLIKMKELEPEVMVIVEQEVDHSSPYFLERFPQSILHYYNVFNSLEGYQFGSGIGKAIWEMNFKQQILNLVACEGVDRVERHETLVKWQNRLCNSGFFPVHLPAKQQLKRTLFSMRIEDNHSCVQLCWNNYPLVVTSVWRPCSGGERRLPPINRLGRPKWDGGDCSTASESSSMITTAATYHRINKPKAAKKHRARFLDTSVTSDSGKKNSDTTSSSSSDSFMKPLCVRI